MLEYRTYGAVEELALFFSKRTAPFGGGVGLESFRLCLGGWREGGGGDCGLVKFGHRETSKAGDEEW